MERRKVIEELTGLFSDILDNNSLSLTEETMAKDVEGWDSLTHIQLVVAIEKHFKIRFTAREIQTWRNVGELMSSIDSRLLHG